MKDMRDETGKGSAWTIIGWAVFFIVLALLIVFGYKTVVYYRLLKSGQMVELPQYTARLTTASGQNLHSSNQTIDPALLVTSDDYTLGADADSSEATVVMFGDYECGFSKEASTVFRRMAVRYGDRVRFVYRDYPISRIHPRAFTAASAAECAGEQRKFWEYHDKLYLNAPALDYSDLSAYAQQVGLDTNQFERCLSDGRYDARVNEDLSLAESLGLRGTPTFFFNGRRVEGALIEADFIKAVDKILQ
jgi:protein-disulfide isomerase